MTNNRTDFSVTLPSNANPVLFPENRINKFTVQLPGPIHMRDYNIALTELQFPCYWKNVCDDCFITIHTSDQEDVVIRITEGYYKDITVLIEEIHRCLSSKQLDNWIQFQWDDIKLKVIVVINNPIYKLTLSSRIAKKLGFSNSLHLELCKSIATECVDLHEGMSSIFIYCSAINPMMVGNVHAPLLRTVPVTPGMPGCIQAEEFKHPSYISGTNIVTDLISIDIKRSDGQHIPFMTGKVNVTLHFQKKI